MATAMGCSHVVAPVAFAGASSLVKSRFLSPTTSLSLGVCNGSRVSMSVEWMSGQPRHAYLDGSAPGEFGFDPLRLGVIPENLERYKESELIHCRWAMLAVIVIAGVNDIPRPVELGDDKHQVEARTSRAQYEIIKAKVCHCLWRIFDSHATRLVEFEYFNGNDRRRGRMIAYF